MYGTMAGSPNWEHLQPCDIAAAETRLQSRQDTDGDGWADEDDCDPYDPWVYPDATLQGCEDTRYGPPDRNCNGIWDWQEQNCGPDYSPIVLDLADDGFQMTSSQDGVWFDLDSEGVAERLSWTIASGDDGWLCLDRNGNGRIDNGTELFGNFTPQPQSPRKSGFLALAVYDLPENGGNADGLINSADSVWSIMGVWVDRNHDGVSQTVELSPVDRVLAGQSISLRYPRRGIRDRTGNLFLYWAKILPSNPGGSARWVADVFLVRHDSALSASHNPRMFSPSCTAAPRAGGVYE